MSNFIVLYVLFCACCSMMYLTGGSIMYINITGSKDNKAEMMDWSKKEAEKETLLYNQCKEKVTVSFSSRTYSFRRRIPF